MGTITLILWAFYAYLAMVSLSFAACSTERGDASPASAPSGSFANTSFNGEPAAFFSCAFTIIVARLAALVARERPDIVQYQGKCD